MYVKTCMFHVTKILATPKIILAEIPVTAVLGMNSVRLCYTTYKVKTMFKMSFKIFYFYTFFVITLSHFKKSVYLYIFWLFLEQLHF